MVARIPSMVAEARLHALSDAPSRRPPVHALLPPPDGRARSGKPARRRARAGRADGVAAATVKAVRMGIGKPRGAPEHATPTLRGLFLRRRSSFAAVFGRRLFAPAALIGRLLFPGHPIGKPFGHPFRSLNRHDMGSTSGRPGVPDGAFPVGTIAPFRNDLPRRSIGIEPPGHRADGQDEQDQRRKEGVHDATIGCLTAKAAIGQGGNPLLQGKPPSR